MLEKLVLDHVAIAVHDLELSKKFYTSLGLNFEGEDEVVEGEKVKVSFASIDKNAHLELLMPTCEESSIAKYLSKNGPGIHHLSFSVDDVEKKSSELKKMGYQMIYPSPKEGANNKWVNFIHPKSSGGVLIEISSPRSKED